MFRRLLTLFGLTGLVVAQPVLDVLANSPATFQVNRIEGRSILVFAFAVTLIPPLVLWAGGEMVRLAHRRSGELVHIGTVALLMGAFGVLLVKEVSGIAVVNLLAGIALAGGAAVLFVRFETFGVWLRVVALANLYFLFHFAFLAPVADWIDSGTRTAAALPTEPATPDETAPVDDPGPPSVVMIVLDELPTQSLLADDATIDPVRFPNLAAFAGEATWYRHFTTTSPFTQSAVPSLLDGLDPYGEPTWVDHPDNLFSLLAGTHHLVVSEALTQMCGFEVCGSRPVPPPPPTEDRAPPVASEASPPTSALPRPEIDTSPRWGTIIDTAWDVWTDRVSPARAGPSRSFDDFQEELTSVASPTTSPPPTATTTRKTGADDEDAAALERFLSTLVGSQPDRLQLFVDALGPTDVPFFGYLHLVLPHQPWSLREDGTAYEVAAGRTDYEADSDEPWPAQVGQQRHLLQAEYADRLLGIVLARLEEIGEYEDTLVVVVSDHGVAFEPAQSSRSLTDENLAAIAYSPLLIKAPGQAEGAIDDQNLNSTDLAPTIASLVGVDLTWDTDGAAAGSEEIRARGGQKYIYDFTDAFDYTFLGVREYDDATEFARLAGGRLPAVGPDESRLAGLYRGVAGGELIGVSVDSLFGPANGSANVAALDRLERPPADEPLLGEIAGRVPGAPADATVLVAVADRVAGVSPLYTRAGRDDSFVVLLDAGMLAPGGNEIRVALRETDGTITELTAEG